MIFDDIDTADGGVCCRFSCLLINFRSVLTYDQALLLIDELNLFALN